MKSSVGYEIFVLHIQEIYGKGLYAYHVRRCRYQFFWCLRWKNFKNKYSRFSVQLRSDMALWLTHILRVSILW